MTISQRTTLPPGCSATDCMAPFWSACSESPSAIWKARTPIRAYTRPLARKPTRAALLRAPLLAAWWAALLAAVDGPVERFADIHVSSAAGSDNRLYPLRHG